jgi:hypothetical protein
MIMICTVKPESLPRYDPVRPVVADQRRSGAADLPGNKRVLG